MHGFGLQFGGGFDDRKNCAAGRGWSRAPARRRYRTAFSRTVRPRGRGDLHRLQSYVGVERLTRRHETVRHSADQWVVGDRSCECCRGPVESLQAQYLGELPPEELEALGPLPGRAGMAVQQPEQPLKPAHPSPFTSQCRSQETVGLRSASIDVVNADGSQAFDPVLRVWMRGECNWAYGDGEQRGVR